MKQMAHEITNRYRDLLIREIQHLGMHGRCRMSPEVEVLVRGIEREKHRERNRVRNTWRALCKPKRRLFWRWLVLRLFRRTRRDDRPRPSDLYLLESFVIAHLDENAIHIRILMLRDLLFNILSSRSSSRLRGYLIDLKKTIEPSPSGRKNPPASPAQSNPEPPMKAPAASAAPPAPSRYSDASSAASPAPSQNSDASSAAPAALSQNFDASNAAPAAPAQDSDASGAALSALSLKSDKPVAIVALRGEAQALLSRLYRRYEGVPAVEALRVQITIGTFARMLAILVTSFLAGMYRPSFYWWACAAGAVGATISTVQRLYALDSSEEPMRTWLTLQNGSGSLKWTPLIGMVFAVVMAMLMLSGILTGRLFPNLEIWPASNDYFYPSPSGDAARFLVWAFAAGWAERLVPDVLSKLTPQASASLRKN